MNSQHIDVYFSLGLSGKRKSVADYTVETNHQNDEKRDIKIMVKLISKIR